ncbi:16S rRNA (cytosine967-C5)-methyltransferase [Bacillus oleivorans]|uniref:16S rRNA (cytosine(967)-C(5))-methyltransferase n=1 Tax=Bacillus oleivorans TaxID=1448271 RepID=A0A285D153_9BACI|nr:16S rRNA (cytosine(967)-C(5))-methyltransferase RsmB [Bacillus oleivorans]SNX73541.1 16S rRNA (cytosine967-C5)-methyltransferase [Bacillus oleivorans]
MTKPNVRFACLNLLTTIDKEQAYSNIVLQRELDKGDYSAKDKALLTEILYGTLQRKLSLDFFLEPFIKGKKVKGWVRWLLRLTLYQIVFLDKIPERAAIYEAVEIAKKRGNKSIAGFVNGVLRSVGREGIRDIKSIEDPVQRLAIETSHPVWLVKRWIAQWGMEETEKMCRENLMAPVQTARVNLNRVSREDALQKLKEEGFAAEPSPLLKEAIRMVKGSIVKSTLFQEGYVTIQDESSMLPAYALGVEDNMIILDACAAPGGKTTHIAEKLHQTGKVHSFDIHDHKVQLIKDNVNRLQLKNVEAEQGDSRQIQNRFADQTFDRILVDAPCSGFGVLKRKPEAKYEKEEKDILQLQKVQLEILNAVAQLLKQNGILVYSTCTIDMDENHETVRAFLQSQSDYVLDESVKSRVPDAFQPFVKEGELQLLPHTLNTDGFFVAAFRRR